ncbi:MAG: hypothetical protein IJS29_02350 [Selenomonadaceae bacterium]|nr:hypothetical protein [Selenomonadaceae bacterium]
MTNQLQVFNNEEFGEIRTAGTADNPLFCLADVCRVLELTVKGVVQRIDKEVISTYPLQTAGGIQQMYFVNEDGLYDVILDSRKPEAKKFRKWITSEVLPSIRKTGAYMTPRVDEVKPSQMVMEIGAMSTALQNTFGVQKGISLLKATDAISNYYNFDLTPLKELVPPAEHELGTLTPTDIGKQIGVPARKVNENLINAGLQVKDGKGYRLTDEGKKYAEAMPYTRNGHSGYQIKWMPKTITFLLEKVIQ